MPIAEVSLGQILLAVVVMHVFSLVCVIMAVHGKDIFRSK